MPGRVLVRFTGGIGRMLDTKRFLKRIVLVGLISTLPGYVSLVSAHGGGHGTGGSAGSGGGSSSSGGGHSSSGGHSSTGMSSGHSSTSMSGRSSGNTKGAQSVTNSKGGRSASDPPTVAGTVVSNQTVSGVNFHSRDHRSFEQNHSNRVHFNRSVSTGETGQNIQNGMVPNEDWKRRHRHMLFGFLPY
jgi:hypothetical protein